MGRFSREKMEKFARSVSDSLWSNGNIRSFFTLTCSFINREHN